MFAILTEGQELPDTPVLFFRKKLPKDRRSSFGIAIKSPFTTYDRYTDPNTFEHFTFTKVRRRFMFHLRFPTYQRFLFSKVRVNIKVD